MNWQNVVWIYVALLVIGGVIGFVKAGSKASLIASLGFALPLVLALLWGRAATTVLIVLAMEFAFFAVRFARTKKFMPGGLLAGASLAAGLFTFFATH